MKIVKQERKKIISVLGLPHAGTTIVCNIFNSMDNAFCLSEPHWTLLSNPSALRFDKAKGLSFDGPEDVVEKIVAKLHSDSQLHFAGLKETYRPKEPRMRKYLDKILDESDFMVFVFREPKAHYNSFKLMAKNHNRNPMPIEYMIDSFDSIHEETNKYTNKIVVILEDLCAAGNVGAIDYINKQAGALLSIKGEFRVKPTDYIYGNHKANRSKNIAPANVSTYLLTKEDISLIDEKLTPKYNDLRG